MEMYDLVVQHLRVDATEDSPEGRLIQHYIDAATEYCKGVQNQGFDLTRSRTQQAILLLVGHWYETREAAAIGTSLSGGVSREIELGVTRLLALDRRGWL